MSNRIANPIIKQIKDTQEDLDYFEEVSLLAESDKTQEIIESYPTVYIHSWEESKYFEVYVGETNDIFKRTRQHFEMSTDKTKWQSKLKEKMPTFLLLATNILINL